MTLYMKCSTPRWLVMRVQVCDYCRGAIEEDGPAVNVRHNFGILCCNEHVPLGQRDCKAWLGINNSVNIWDAKVNPHVGRFLSMLEGYQGGFPVVRTSGVIDNGWKLMYPSYEHACDIRKTTSNSWRFMVDASLTKRNIVKEVRMEDYLRDDIAARFPDYFKEIVQAAIAALDMGIYKEEVRIWKELSEDPDAGVMPDIPQIKNVVNSSGVEFRVFVP